MITLCRYASRARTGNNRRASQSLLIGACG
jgi:cytochrome b561